MRILHYIGILLVLTLGLSACNQSDDVQEIFLHKTWKLTAIGFRAANGGYVPYAPQGDLKDWYKDLNKEADNCTVTFFQNIHNGQPEGVLQGKGVNIPFKGSWSADGKSRNMQIHLDEQNMEGGLAGLFYYGLNNVYRYEGDSKSLYLYYKDGQKEYYISMIPKN